MPDRYMIDLNDTDMQTLLTMLYNSLFRARQLASSERRLAAMVRLGRSIVDSFGQIEDGNMGAVRRICNEIDGEFKQAKAGHV